MKKYSFLVYHKEYDEFLKKIQELGVVHIIEKESGEIEDEALGEKYAKLQQLKTVYKVLKNRIKEEKEDNSLSSDEIIEKVLSTLREIELKEQYINSLDKEISVLEPWGDFKIEDLKKLKEQGIIIKFFNISGKKMNPGWAENYNLEIINNQGSLVYFVVIMKDNEELDIDAEEIRLPNKSLSHLMEERKRTFDEINGFQKDLDELAETSLHKLEKAEIVLTEQIDFNKVELSTSLEAEDKLMIIQGWIPGEKEEGLIQSIDNEGVFYTSEIPSEDDKPPIYLKNNKFARLFEPIGELYTFPDYKELDLTPFFAPFFMMFFGFCLGDAGYGLLILLATIILRGKVKKELKPVMTLGMFLGIATIIMGILGGTVFGVILLEKKFEWLSSYNKFILDDKKLMLLAVAMGFIQILFGMFLKAFNYIRYKGFKYSLSTFGWIEILIGGAIILYFNKVKDVEFTDLKTPLYIVLGIGGFMVFFLNSPGKNIFLNFGLGIWDTYGTASGLLGDLLSYIRLFALGISSAVLGSVFNQLAFELSPDTIVVRQLVIILILLFGHSLNLFMAALGSFVHPLRLTFVEFYKNADFLGGGKKYSPFRKQKVRNN